jgi:hypothetical protein
MNELPESVAVVEPPEADATYDALCQYYYSRTLHDHTAVRRRTLGLLTDAACVTWPWNCVRHHCGLSADFLTLVREGLQFGVDQAIANAEEEGRGSLVRGDEDTPMATLAPVLISTN